MQDSKIEWTTNTWNPWIGCAKVHTGCTNCYAEADQDTRRGRVKWGPNGTRSKTSESYWREPLKWNEAARHSQERPRVFCCSLADVFEDWSGPILNHKGKPLNALLNVISPDTTLGSRIAPLTLDDLRVDLFGLIDQTPHLDWLLLTKRPQNVRRMMPSKGSDDRDAWHDGEPAPSLKRRDNVWIGTSVSDQQTYDHAAPELLKLRDLCSKLFISAEPLLGPINFRFYKPIKPDLVIFGGESGPNARVCYPEWIMDGAFQCHRAGVAAFAKQLGSNVETANVNILDWQDRVIVSREPPTVAKGPYSAKLRFTDKKGGDWNEWPEELRVRDMPS